MCIIFLDRGTHILIPNMQLFFQNSILTRTGREGEGQKDSILLWKELGFS